MTKKIMIVDNHFIIREGLKLIFETNDSYDISYEASNGEEAINILEKKDPDLILLDIKMEKVDGFGVMTFVKNNKPNIPVVILSTFDNVDNIKTMLSLGAKGYLLKDSSTETIFNTVNNAINGNVVLQNKMTDILFNPENNNDYNLQNIEIEILELLAKGYKIKVIADKVHLSERTVKSHLTSIYTKMDVANGIQAVALGIKNSIIKF